MKTKQDVKPISWAELKEFANNLTESQLEFPVKWWGDSCGGNITGVEVMDEDYVNPSGDGAEPLSAYADDPEIDQEPRVALKDQPMLQSL